MIGNLGFFELTLFGVIALIVLGPEKLPVAARTVGRWYGAFRRGSQKLQNDISNELQLLETQELLKKELEQIRQSEAQMKAQMDALRQSIYQNQAQFRAAPRQAMDSQMDTWQSIDPDDAATARAPAITPALQTMPMTNRWFLLGDYDARRRLPPAPRLPNYRADTLLYDAHSNHLTDHA